MSSLSVELCPPTPNILLDRTVRNASIGLAFGIKRIKRIYRMLVEWKVIPGTDNLKLNSKNQQALD